MQIHNRMSIDQVTLVLSWYQDRKIRLPEALLKLGVKRRRFFYLLKVFKAGKVKELGHKAKKSSNRISEPLEKAIRSELTKEQEIIHNPDIPTDIYNYTHVRDEVRRITGGAVSVETIRRRAVEWGFYVKKYKKEKAHDRLILTDKAGTLLQHDSSIHLFAPYSGVKWYLITTIEDYSRALLYARFFEEETTWDHILAIKEVCLKYGIPKSYYVDNHSIFRFVARMESYWRVKRTNHSDVLTAWEAVLKSLNVGVIHALSPQAKGKIERPYRWLQDRVVRRCAKEKITKIQDAQKILDEEVDRYNWHTRHSTTSEVPMFRLKNAKDQGKSVFRKFEVPKPLRAIEDVFCLREPRVVSGYHTVAWRNHQLKVPGYVPIGTTVILHVVPDFKNPMIRIWYKDELIDQIFLAPTNREYITKIHED